MVTNKDKIAGDKYMAYITEPHTIKNAQGTGKVYDNTLNGVRKAIYKKAKTVRWHTRTYLGGHHPQYFGGIWKLGWAPINFTDKEWKEIAHVGMLVYDTEYSRLLQEIRTTTPTGIITRWRVVRSDGSLGSYINFSMNLI